MMKRIVLGVLAMGLAAAGFGLSSQSGAHAEPVASQGPTMVVYGPNTLVLAKAVAYWDGLAGWQVLAYGGAAAPLGDDPESAVLSVQDLPTGLAGLTLGNVGGGRLTVQIDTRAAGDWVVYAHELGHTLGLGHHDEPGYMGVMRSDPEGYSVRSSDDKRFVSSV